MSEDRSQEIILYPYSWHTKEEEIHVYTFNPENEVCLLRIKNFTPYLYVKLPRCVHWDVTMKTRLLNIFKKSCRIQNAEIVYKKPLYYSNLSITIDSDIVSELHPYMFISFVSDEQRKKFTWYVKKKQKIFGIEKEIELEFYEVNASPVLQLTVCRKISTADWFKVIKPKLCEDKISSCKFEYTVGYKNISPLNDIENNVYQSIIPRPLVLSWDIESYSHDPNCLPDGKHQEDVVFQISCVVKRLSSENTETRKILLTLGDPEEKSLLDDVEILRFKSEMKLLLGFKDLINRISPQILIGYNIFKFDIPFLYERCCLHYILDDFVRHGYTYEKCKKENIKWSSSAYSNQEMNFFDLQGRITIDLHTLIKRDFNLESYKLNYVAEKYLGAKKDPLTHLDIFMCYRKGIKEESSTSLGIVGKYCVKDSILVMDLFEKFQYWYSLTEMSKICQVPLAHLFLYGQQLKVFSQVYRYCFDKNLVVESGRYKTSEEDYCAGAYVFTPEPGIYDNVVSFDFASLYPSIIISHNIDYTTLVLDPRIPDSMCNIVEWPEHINCTCDDSVEDTDYAGVICTIYKFRWLREPAGVLPTIIRNLLQARKSVRNKMKSLEKNSVMWSILNNRQLAYKVSSNSMYGALTTKKGYLPFLPGGMCITAVGRKSICKVSDIITKDYHGKVIYGDTDSNYVIFPHISNLKTLWNHCIHVSEGVSKHFPEPMKLEFEDSVYSKYLILSKKRYLYFSTDADGNVSNKIDNKGVLLKRRDNSKIIRQIYEDIIRMFLEKKTEYELLEKLLAWIAILYSRNVPLEYYTISKSVKEIQNFTISAKTSKKIRYGDYLVPKLKENPDEKSEQLAKKGVKTEEEFYRSHLPGPVKLALRMRNRGQQIESGSRLSYVITKMGDCSNIGDRIEETEYFQRYYSKKWIDTRHYLFLLTKPIEEVFCVIYGKKYKSFIKSICQTFKRYDMVVNQIRSWFEPIILEGAPKKMVQKNLKDFVKK